MEEALLTQILHGLAYLALIGTGVGLVMFYFLSKSKKVKS